MFQKKKKNPDHNYYGLFTSAPALKRPMKITRLSVYADMNADII